MPRDEEHNLTPPFDTKQDEVRSLLEEHRLSLNELAQNQRVNASTAWRWALKGVGGVRLETFQLGGRRFTTTEAWHRWHVRLNASRHSDAMSPRTNPQRDAAITRAEQELKDAGV